LEQHGLVHRDIKDENVVVDSEYRIKLIDFGSASPIPTCKEDYFKRYNGTPHFAAPEIVRRRAYKGPQAEVWTLGVLLYTIIFGENPFHNAKDILAYDGRLLYPRYIESDLRRLLENMLCVDVKKRWTLQRVNGSNFRLWIIPG
jgi:serine/threonine protein kinase